MSFKSRLSIASSILVLACPMVFGQVYTPPPGGTTSPGYTPPSGGYSVNKAALGAGIGAGVGAGVLFMMMRHRGTYTGCVAADGKSLVRKDGKTFQLVGTELKPGEKFSLKAKKDKDDSNGLNVVDVKKDFGPCEK